MINVGTTVELKMVACAAFAAISVLVQRSQMAPVRCGFWRASPNSPQAPASTPKTSPTKPSQSQTAPDSSHSQPGLPRAPSQGTIPPPGAQLSPAKSTDARPPKHRRSGSGSKAFQGPFSYNPDVLLSPVEPFIAQVSTWYPLLQCMFCMQRTTRSHIVGCKCQYCQSGRVSQVLTLRAEDKLLL